MAEEERENGGERHEEVYPGRGLYVYHPSVRDPLQPYNRIRLQCVDRSSALDHARGLGPSRIDNHPKPNLPLVGLYENGVDLGDNIFLPYREVARVDRKKGWVRMRPMYPWILPFGLRIPERWALRLDLLGEEGLEELEARVAGRPTGEEPPRLVLYGG